MTLKKILCVIYKRWKIGRVSCEKGENMIKIAICDDEILIATEIENLILDIAKKQMIEVDTELYFNASSLEESFLYGNKYDFLYLDIQMKDHNGIIAAQNIRKIDINVLIIYVSGYAKFVEDVFEVDAFDFIRKPIDIRKFEKCFLRACQKIVDNTTNFECHYKNEWLKFSIGEILYFESRGRKIRIYLVDGKKEEFNGKLDEVERNLKNSKLSFLRIHKSYLVNFHFIRAFARKEIRLVNGEMLPVSLDRYNEIKEKYGKLLGGEICDK